MADRKISELPEALSVASGDYMVVVTGVGIQDATLSTNRFPLSGLINNIVNINELVNNGTGIYIAKNINTNNPNTININATGLAYSIHSHTSSDITDFNAAVSGQIQQIIKFQTSDLANTGTALLESPDLAVPLSANSKYLCQLGTILMTNENANISGIINVTGTMSVNYPTVMYGTWNHLEIDNQGHGIIHNEKTSVTGYGLIVDTVGTDGLGNAYTLVNNFVVQTTSNEADTITFGFATNSVNQSTSGVLKQGSWLKVEKII